MSSARYVGLALSGLGQPSQNFSVTSVGVIFNQWGVEPPQTPDKSNAGRSAEGVGHWDWCPPPQPTKMSGERRKFPQWGPGQSPGRQCIFGIFEAHRTAHKKLIFVKTTQSID